VVDVGSALGNVVVDVGRVVGAAVVAEVVGGAVVGGALVGEPVVGEPVGVLVVGAVVPAGGGEDVGVGVGVGAPVGGAVVAPADDDPVGAAASGGGATGPRSRRTLREGEVAGVGVVPCRLGFRRLLTAVDALTAVPVSDALVSAAPGVVLALPSSMWTSPTNVPTPAMARARAAATGTSSAGWNPPRRRPGACRLRTTRLLTANARCGAGLWRSSADHR
jgi:hypothetical protein